MAFASLSPDISSRIDPLIPALQSNWLTSHVLTCFMGYAAFTVAFGLGIMYFLKIAAAGKKGEMIAGFFHLLPDEGVVDELIYQSTAQGFVFLTLELGSKRDLFSHYLAHLRADAPRAPCPRLAGQAYGTDEHYRICLCTLYLSGSELSGRVT